MAKEKTKTELKRVDILNILCEAARKRDMSYGTFMIATTEEERREIVGKCRKENKL